MAKEKLKMDSAQIARIMGTVGSPLIVISELLKNAVDASAENIDIYYDFDSKSILKRLMFFIFDATLPMNKLQTMKLLSQILS